MKIRRVEADLFHADLQTDGETELTIAFRHFTMGLNKYILLA
jgi:hypothetical protein